MVDGERACGDATEAAGTTRMTEKPGSPEGDIQETPPAHRVPLSLRKLYDTWAGNN